EDRQGGARPERRRSRFAREDRGGARYRGGGVMRLAGQVSLVTGASRGIGRAIAAALAAEGATVCLAAGGEAKRGEAVGAITGAGGKAVALRLDVADRGSVEAAFETILNDHGRIDHLVNNAGITRDNLLLRMKAADWDDVLATNLTGVFHCTQVALR